MHKCKIELPNEQIVLAFFKKTKSFIGFSDKKIAESVSDVNRVSGLSIPCAFFQIDPHATLDVSKALKRAPQAVIEITTSYKISRPRSADNLSFTINPRGGMLDRRLSLSPNHWIHQSQLQQRSYLRGISVLGTAAETMPTSLQETQNHPAQVR